MDDLIYGLLVVAWVVYGIYSASKKNKAKGSQQPTSRPATSQSKDTIEAVFESFFQGSSPNPLATPHPYSQPEYVEESPDYENLDSYQDQNMVERYEESDYLDVVPEPFIESKIDTYSGTDNVQQAIVVDQEDENDTIKNSAIDHVDLANEEEESVVFDLRQGILAQAILERPYK